MGTKLDIIKKLQKIQRIIIKADSVELDKIGMKITEIEKEIMSLTVHCGELKKRGE